MKRSNRPWLFFTVSTAALAVSSVLVGMTNHRTAPAVNTVAPQTLELPVIEAVSPAPEVSSRPNAKGFTSTEMKAKNVLTDELHRRFTDRQNVDFGMSRVVRVGARNHYGPTMDKTQRGVKEKTRQIENGRFEFEFDGAWYKMDERKPRMIAENENESQAMKVFRDGKVDAAIYTLGQFELDKGETPEPHKEQGNANPNYRGFSYGSGASIRVKGPAYIHQNSTMAPRSYELVNFGRLAWASKQTDYVAEGKDGWVYFAHRVDSSDVSCAKCHGNRKAYIGGKAQEVQGAVQKAGDPVGLFVIALRRVDGK